MPTYPSSLLLGVAPGTRAVNNYTSRFEFRFDNEPNAMSAAGFAAAIPIILLTAVASRQIVAGLTAGAVKS